MEEYERYLGGFYSPIHLALVNVIPGAGIYATDKRLILPGKGDDLDPTFKKTVTGSGRTDFDSLTLTTDQNQAILKELSSESRKRLVLRKDQITRMEIKQPPGMFRAGHLKVLLTSGATIKLVIGNKKTFEQVDSLLQSFNPQAVQHV
jgi:hypothetical protein